MSDISKCSNSEECILKERCFRNTAAESEIKQSWIEGTPVKNKIDECIYYEFIVVYRKQLDN